MASKKMPGRRPSRHKTKSVQTTSVNTLSRLYLITVITASCLAVGGQILTQQMLSRQTADARVINVAGRQRMLSQKIAKAAYSLQNTQNRQRENRAVQEELVAALEDFQQAHEGLQEGSEQLNLTKTKSEDVQALFADIEADYQTIVMAARVLSRPAAGSQSVAVRTIAEHEADFLRKMNTIVLQYETEATARVTQLQTVQQGLLVLLLLSLLPVLVPIYRISHRLREIIHTIQSAGIQVTSSSLQISASGKQLEAMAAEQAAASAQITASSKEIAANVLGLNERVQQVVAQAQQTQDVASQSEQSLAGMSLTLGHLDEMSAAAAERLGVISDRANNIERVVSAMTKVTDQTNLLSLNAAIEAEKAGEYGAGFAVVASEIRKLANRSAIATLEIESLVKDMHSAVATGVTEIETLSQQVSKSVATTSHVIQQTAEIAQQVRLLKPQLDQVNEGIGEQSMSAEQISEAMVQLDLGTQQTVESLQETNQALTVLKDTATALQAAVMKKGANGYAA